ncbi:MAG: hypothetical protein QXV21_04485, partial [Candidatus Bathyarchaeia archaeon]
MSLGRYLPIVQTTPYVFLRKLWHYLSIPFAWDFSMHLGFLPSDVSLAFYLSIPFAWDFSMH